MMQDMLRELAYLSVIFGVIVTLIPDRGTRHVTELLCSCLLILCVFRPIASMEFDSFAADMAQYRQRERELTEKGGELRDRLNRSVIEKEYAAYITDKGKELGTELGNVSVAVRWDTEGIWVPWETYIEYEGDEKAAEALKTILTAELGIPEERQTWSR